jgi:transcriptional regulator of nitric oxide reductase
LRKVGVLAVLVVIGGLMEVAAQRMFLDPFPEAYLKRLFPTAVTFTPRDGEPPHMRAYAVDPRTALGVKPIGYAFWTPDLVPQERGYHAPIHILVGMDPTGHLTGVVVDYHSEPYGYFSVEPKDFAAQFKGKDVRDMFRVGMDIHAVSRATISVTSASRAIRMSSRMIARKYLRRPEVTP